MKLSEACFISTVKTRFNVSNFKTKTKMNTKERQGKVNTIISEIEEFMFEFPPQYETDKESMLGYFSNIICQLDTDIAIEVMKDFGKAGENQATSIKVNYGY